jgi:hypothetical protein
MTWKLGQRKGRRRREENNRALSQYCSAWLLLQAIMNMKKFIPYPKKIKDPSLFAGVFRNFLLYLKKA